MSRRIVVIGSIAIDNTIYTNKLPSPGTTTIADSYITNIGGKGANQACASMFLGASTTFIGAVGKDNNGKMVEEFLSKCGLNYRIKESDKPTGVAFIVIDESNAENQILIVQGANTDLQIEDIDKNLDLFKEGDILLTQFENSIETVEYVVKKAKEAGMIVIVNPAPIKKVHDRIYKYIDYLVPNEHELEQLTDTKEPIKACRILLYKGCKNIIVTLGEKGSMLINKKAMLHLDPIKVKAVDTTAAGDTYLGALVSKLAEDAPIEEAMKFASKASAYTVTKKGAIIALPHLSDLE